MLSYQHGFHAGNRADVLKHAVLDLILGHLARSARPVLHVETHAGRGVYDLTGAQARKTRESDEGVLAMLASGQPPAALQGWLDLVASQTPQAYPGSPKLAALRLGNRGRLVLFEKHPAEHEALATAFAGDRRVLAHKADGYSGALKLAPRRGEEMLVLADPSYETAADMEALADWTPRALARWPHALIAVWLPLFRDGREADFGAYLLGLEDGVVAGARWPVSAGRDTALAGSAMIAYRLPQSLSREGVALAGTLEAFWKGA